MNLIPTRLSLLLGLLTSTALVTYAGTPLGGLTVAVTADGSKLVVGGDTRTLLVLNPDTLEVKERHWIEADITALAFNPNGSLLAAQGSDDTVRIFNTADWKKKVEIPKCLGFTTSSNLIAGHDGSYKGANVTVYSFADGSKKLSIPFPQGIKIAAMALKPDGSNLAILTEGEKDASEKEVPYAQIPKDLKGLYLEEFKQKNDGKSSQLIIIDPTSGKKLSETKIYYSTNTGSTLFFSGDKLIALNYTNLNATLTPTGEVSLFQMQNSFNYGIGLTADKKLIISGGLRDFSMTLAENLSSTTGSIDQLPSWPEYWKGFSGITGGDAIYGTTTAYRVFKLTGEGKIIKGSPVK